MRIIVDAMGGDYAPVEILKGCINAVDEYGIPLTLVGQEEVIKSICRHWEHRWNPLK